MAKKSLLAGNVQTSKRRNVKTTAAPAALITHETRRVPVGKIARAAYNPRAALSPADPEYGKLKRSIEQYGMVEDLVWNERTGNLVGGHQRLSVLVAEFGATEVDVKVVSLSPAKEKALNVALNKVSGRWDEEKLSALLLELSASEEVKATDTGFDDLEIAAALARETPRETAVVQTPGNTKVGSYGVQVICPNPERQRTCLELLARKGYEAMACVI